MALLLLLGACGGSSEADSDGPASAAGAGGTGGQAGASGDCPGYEPVDVLDDTPRLRGACSTPGATCTTDRGPTLCRGFGVGQGLAEAHCACDGGQWSCLPHTISKSSGCPLQPCSLLAPQAGPLTPRTGLLHCAVGQPSCTTELREVCADGSPGQAVSWSCDCVEGGSYTCTPTLAGESLCQ